MTHDNPQFLFAHSHIKSLL